MKLTTSFKKFLLEKKWVQSVKPKWHPPEGTFAKDADPKKSAEIICKGHKGDLKKSVASVNFYFNRKKKESGDEARRKAFIDALHKVCKG